MYIISLVQCTHTLYKYYKKDCSVNNHISGYKQWKKDTGTFAIIAGKYKKSTHCKCSLVFLILKDDSGIYC